MSIPGQASGHAANHGDRKQCPQFFTVRAVAEHLDISSRTVHRWIKNNELAVHRVGRCVRISEADLKQYLAARRYGA
ncbi:helix-turn-helix domain-containing protein [Bradyrhizobium sp. 6(2017)]|uniref:helix-turn-helix domain-containing protein n=1 Tax=Bradyrhizobium sp. 6(2017) TaxID=1197460 RepID=UPI0013E1A8AB|nr:helix-turn-helix domain-containing protein [Bradyrhizobium sp. 6(2017)]